MNDKKEKFNENLENMIVYVNETLDDDDILKSYLITNIKLIKNYFDGYNEEFLRVTLE